MKIRINFLNGQVETGIAGKPFASKKEAMKRLQTIRDANHGSPAMVKIETQNQDGDWIGERV
jgi:hypothetical protein